MKLVIAPTPTEPNCSRNHDKRSMHHENMDRETDISDWEELLSDGENIIDYDFTEAAEYWCDALDEVPEEHFDEAYRRILDSMENSFVHRTWKSAEGINIDGMDELAFVVSICSPDRYELMPELVKRLEKHLGDMKRFDYVSELLDLAVLFSRVTFDVDTYLDSYSDMCKLIIGFCDNILEMKDKIFENNPDQEMMDAAMTIAVAFKGAFSDLGEAIDEQQAKIVYQEVLRIGFDWMEVDDRPYLNDIASFYDSLSEAACSGPTATITDNRNWIIRRFMNAYLGKQ